MIVSGSGSTFILPLLGSFFHCKYFFQPFIPNSESSDQELGNVQKKEYIYFGTEHSI